MRNFDYIKDLGLNDLYRFCSAAEENQWSSPDFSAINARKALEYIVRAVYYLKDIEVKEKASLFELVDGEPFRAFINDDKVMMAVHYVRKVGNNGAHTGNVTRKEAFFALLNIYNVVGAILLKLKLVEEVKPFDKDLIPKAVETPVVVPAKVEVKENDTIVVAADKESVADATPVEVLPTDLSEAETRKMFIDLMLREAGWEVLETEGAVQPLKACIEVEVHGMPNTEGIGYADYVLFGSNGLPLAVVEAKRTTASPLKGKHQAELYADCLEKQYGVRPVIYYTNGFETNIIDGLGYPPRPLFGFHTADDLERLIQKRGRKDITDFSVKDSITDRHYQKMAIKAVCEHYNKKHRKALLVMATGTGKTRVSISLVDVLMRNDWVKNVLFLADRTSLVSQAHKNYAKLLPNTTTCVLSDKSNENKDINARIVFSTYQTMINYIDTDEKLYSVGHFDLIVIDEAHRSIFGKYAAVFNYFDAMLVGLTATPREDVDRSTYEIFQMEEGEPNFAYELDEAVVDKYLVNYHGFKRGSKIMREGIKYEKLTEEQKRQLELVWEYESSRYEVGGMRYEAGDSNLKPPTSRDIESSEIFNYIFNEDTIDAVLQDLMENGLKVQSGERIGKSVIFAYNHRHAEMIVGRFNALYPEYGAGFCVLIDNYITYAHDLIDKFEIRDANPQIAVSVDMLDTGIDVPDILNLVFFKPIKSKIKFLQMIGRGTRLSENIFGPGKDKECFYIFDWCGNFDYFDQNPDGQEAPATQSLTERLFCLRSEIAFNLQHQQWQEDEYCKSLHDEIKALLHEQVETLSDSHISVRMKWEAVSHFKEKEAWTYISDLDLMTLKNDIAPLLPKSTLDESAKKFDVLTLTIELGCLDKEVNASKSIQRVKLIAEKLEEMATLPQVQAKMGTIKEVLSDVAWQNVSLQWLEKVRTDLRDLMKFLLGDKKKWFVVDIDDVISDEGEVEGVTPRVSYRQRVMDFLADNRHLPVLDKIYNMEKLEDADFQELQRILWEELGTREDYNRYTQGKMCGDNVAVLIRSLIGVDRKVAMQRFGSFISGVELNSEQEEFLMTVISYVCENGDITKEIVVNEPPFDERLDVFSAYMIPLARYIENIHNVVIPLYPVNENEVSMAAHK